MEDYDMYHAPGLRDKAPWPLVASSLWLRLVFVGGAAAVVALTQLYHGEANPFWAIAWIFAGAWLATYSWRRARLLLDSMDSSDPEAAAPALKPILPKTPSHPAWDRRDVKESAIASRARG
jgi:hypothetical protein